MQKHTMLWVFLTLVALLPGVSTHAQNNDEWIAEGEPPIPAIIESVTVERTENNELFLSVEWMSGNCLVAEFETQVANNVISVQAASPAQIEDLACDSPAFGEQDIYLGDDFQNDESYAIVVNDFVGEIYLPRPDGVLMDHPTQQAPVGDTLLAPAVPVYSSIDEISVDISEDDTLVFSLAGTHPDGCSTMVYARFVPDIVDEMRHLLEVFRFRSPFIDCTAEVQPYEIMLETNLNPEDVHLIEADNRLYEYAPELGELIEMVEEDEGMEPDGNNRQVFTVIESVEVAVLESFPMQLELTISGHQPDGCDVPVQVEQEVDGNNVTISIYRELPVDVMCPAVLMFYEETIRVDGSFEGGTVTIQVNEFSTSVDL